MKKIKKIFKEILGKDVVVLIELPRSKVKVYYAVYIGSDLIYNIVKPSLGVWEAYKIEFPYIPLNRSVKKDMELENLLNQIEEK